MHFEDNSMMFREVGTPSDPASCMGLPLEYKVNLNTVLPKMLGFEIFLLLTRACLIALCSFSGADENITVGPL